MTYALIRVIEKRIFELLLHEKKRAVSIELSSDVITDAIKKQLN